MRLNIGCGGQVVDGWENADVGGTDDRIVFADLRDVLPWPDQTFDVVVAHHVLQMLDYLEVEPALLELRRVLAFGGVLRISVPNVVAGIRAHARGDIDWFPPLVGEETTLDGRFCTWVTDYGRTRTVFTHGRLIEICERARLEAVRADCRYSPFGADLEGVCDLDGRCGESAYVEARR